MSYLPVAIYFTVTALLLSLMNELDRSKQMLIIGILGAIGGGVLIQSGSLMTDGGAETIYILTMLQVLIASGVFFFPNNLIPTAEKK